MAPTVFPLLPPSGSSFLSTLLSWGNPSVPRHPSPLLSNTPVTPGTPRLPKRAHCTPQCPHVSSGVPFYVPTPNAHLRGPLLFPVTPTRPHPMLRALCITKVTPSRGVPMLTVPWCRLSQGSSMVSPRPRTFLHFPQCPHAHCPSLSLPRCPEASLSSVSQHSLSPPWHPQAPGATSPPVAPHHCPQDSPVSNGAPKPQGHLAPVSQCPLFPQCPLLDVPKPPGPLRVPMPAVPRPQTYLSPRPNAHCPLSAPSPLS